MTRRDLEAATREIAARDPRLGEWIRRIGPVGLRRQQHRFGALCRSIIGQQLSAKAAATIHGRFLERLDRARRPDPADVLRLSTSELRECGLSARKVEYIRALARAFDDGELSRVRFGSLADEEVVARLTRLPGIGAWTAEMFLIFALGRPDVYSAGDLALRAGVERVEARQLTPREAAEVAARWSPWRSAASLYLWRIAHWRPDERP